MESKRTLVVNVFASVKQMMIPSLILCFQQCLLVSKEIVTTFGIHSLTFAIWLLLQHTKELHLIKLY